MIIFYFVKWWIFILKIFFKYVAGSGIDGRDLRRSGFVIANCTNERLFDLLISHIFEFMYSRVHFVPKVRVWQLRKPSSTQSVPLYFASRTLPLTILKFVNHLQTTVFVVVQELLWDALSGTGSCIPSNAYFRYKIYARIHKLKNMWNWQIE